MTIDRYSFAYSQDPAFCWDYYFSPEAHETIEPFAMKASTGILHKTTQIKSVGITFLFALRWE